MKSRLSSLIEDYYTMLGFELDKNLPFSKLKKIGQNLPLMPETAYSSGDLKRKLYDLEKDRQEKQENLLEVETTLDELEDVSKYASDYALKLQQIESTIEFDDDIKEIRCPICHNEVQSIEKTLDVIRKSKNKLMNDLKKTGIYKNDNSEQLSYWRGERDKVKREIRNLTAKINQLKEQDKQFKEKRQLRDQVMVLKGKIEANVKQILDENSLAIDAVDIDELKVQIKDLKEKIDGYSLKFKYEEANTFLHNRMNEICNALDFEEELKPANLHFDLQSFSFYHIKDKNKIYLSEMGSGANWLACHLSLFLALLHLICKEKKSCIPSFLFIDQPSQVYFPKEFAETDENKDEYDENIIQVQNIFNVLLREICKIKTEYKYIPQIIVMEHADKLQLENADFNSFVQKRWAKNGEKLI